MHNKPVGKGPQILDEIRLALSIHESDWVIYLRKNPTSSEVDTQQFRLHEPVGADMEYKLPNLSTLPTLDHLVI